MTCRSDADRILQATPWRWLGRIDFADAVALDHAASARLRAAPAARGEIIAFEPAAAVFTLGRRAQTPAGRAALAPTLVACAARGIAVVDVERGGLGTLHVPGQLVVFLAVPCPRTRLRALVCELLVAARAVATAAGQSAVADADAEVGLWASGTAAGTEADSRGAKLASIGLFESRGVVSHGLSLNVAIDPAEAAGLALCGSAATRYASLLSVASPGGRTTAVHAAAVAFADALRLEPAEPNRHA